MCWQMFPSEESGGNSERDHQPTTVVWRPNIISYNMESLHWRPNQRLTSEMQDLEEKADFPNLENLFKFIWKSVWDPLNQKWLGSPLLSLSSYLVVMMTLLIIWEMKLMVMVMPNLINNKWLVRAWYAVGADIAESWGTVSVSNKMTMMMIKIINNVMMLMMMMMIK